jgi:hypothetical protein
MCSEVESDANTYYQRERSSCLSSSGSDNKRKSVCLHVFKTRDRSELIPIVNQKNRGSMVIGPWNFSTVLQIENNTA